MSTSQLYREGELLGFDEDIAFEVLDTSRDIDLAAILLIQTDPDHDKL